jgi:hypothetical protein
MRILGFGVRGALDHGSSERLRFAYRLGAAEHEHILILAGFSPLHLQPKARQAMGSCKGTRPDHQEGHQGKERRPGCNNFELLAREVRFVLVSRGLWDVAGRIT